MFKKFYILGFLILGVVFITSGFYLGKAQNGSPKSSEKLVLNSVSTPTISASPKQEKIVPKDRQALPAGRQGFVKKVLDGDTVETDKSEKVRYIGINSPETGQPFFSQAQQANQDLVLNKTVKLEFDVEQKDRYGRTLAYIFAGDKFINLEMIKKGLAVSETIQPDVKYQDVFVKAQEQARDGCLGLWEGLCSNKTSSCIEIVSINADAKGNDNLNKNGEWVDIKNTCSNAVSMNGWLLKDSSASNKYQFKNFSLDSGKDTLLHSGCGQDTNSDIYWSCPEGKYAIWNNAGDEAFLYNEKGELVSDYRY